MPAINSMNEVTAETCVTPGFVGEVTELLTSFLDYEETLAAVAQFAVRALSDICIIDVLENDVLRRLEVAHSLPSPGTVVRDLRGSEPDEQRGLSRVVLDSGLSVLEPPTAFNAGGPRRAEAIRMLRWVEAESLIAVPMLSSSGPVGVMTLISKRLYGRCDLGMAENLARFAGLELDNARHYREARRALQARDNILGIVAHDLRNPLSTILMSADLLRDLPLTAEQRRHQIDVIVSSGRRMNRLIQDLLDVARVENEQLPLELDIQRPHELVRDAVALNTAHAAGRSLYLRAGDCDTTASIRADRDRLLQVLCNLIENAIKFTPEGGTIDVCAMPIESGVSFTVRDSGPGIPEADLRHVFETFWQKSHGSIGGAGLGLAIARGIVEAHGGTIGVESTVGSGSRFWFIIPSTTSADDDTSLGGPSDSEHPRYPAANHERANASNGARSPRSACRSAPM